VTIYYAIQNRRMAQEMRRAREALIRPKLALDFHRLGPTAMTLGVKNIGPGPAFAIDIKMVYEPITGTRCPRRDRGRATLWR